MTRTIISKLQFPRLRQIAMADKSTVDKLRAKGLSGVTFGDIAFTFVDKRHKTPTAWGYLTLVLIGYFIVSSLRAREPIASGLDEKDLQINPKFQKVGFGGNNDPQEEEFRKVLVDNLRADKPKLPLFNANKHKDDRHPAQIYKKQAELDRYGYPNPKQFPVNIIAKPNIACPGEKGQLLVIVASHPDNGGGRNAIRASWGFHETVKYPSLTKGMAWKTIFVMGQSGHSVFDSSVVSEANTHTDVLVGHFHDTPHEDTRKFMMATKWVKENMANCDFKFVLKTKDDIYHNMVSITNWLEAKYPAQGSSDDLYVGKLLRLDRPIRDSRDPLFVPESDFNREFFPNLIHGPVYLFTKHSFFKIADRMSAVTPIAMEDAYVGLLAEAAGITPTHNDHFQLLGKTGNVCHHLRMFFISPIMPSEHVTVFKKVKLARTSGECVSAQWVDEDGRHRNIEV